MQLQADTAPRQQGTLTIDSFLYLPSLNVNAFHAQPLFLNVGSRVEISGSPEVSEVPKLGANRKRCRFNPSRTLFSAFRFPWRVPLATPRRQWTQHSATASTSGRLARWTLRIQEYGVSVVIKTGRILEEADCYIN